MVIPTTVRALLAKHLDTVDQAPQALVFTSSTGQPLRYSILRNRAWLPATEAAGLPGLDIHEPRHTAASLRIRAGADPKLIQTQLGHASIAITHDVHGHLLPDRPTTIHRAAIAGILGGSSVSERVANRLAL